MKENRKILLEEKEYTKDEILNYINNGADIIEIKIANKKILKVAEKIAKKLNIPIIARYVKIEKTKGQNNREYNKINKKAVENIYDNCTIVIIDNEQDEEMLKKHNVISKIVIDKNNNKEIENLAINIKRQEIEEENEDEIKTIIMNIIGIIMFSILTAIGLWLYNKGYFSNIEELNNFMTSTGIWAPLVFILFQIVQVLVPIIPGGVTLSAGVILFGPIQGFIYNYISIVIGSFLAYMLSKAYGKKIIRLIFSRALSKKYLKWAENEKHYKKIFIISILIPAAPDDLLCYIAGTTKMKISEFILIMLLGKPISLLGYSLGFTSILS